MVWKIIGWSKKVLDGLEWTRLVKKVLSGLFLATSYLNTEHSPSLLNDKLCLLLLSYNFQ